MTVLMLVIIKFCLEKDAKWWYSLLEVLPSSYALDTSESLYDN